MRATKEQIQWFWEQCGVEFYENDGRFWARTPSGGATELLIDLNNLFKYAVPRVVSYDLQNLPYKYEGQHTAIICMADGEYYKADSKDPAIALFWAIFKALGGK